MSSAKEYIDDETERLIGLLDEDQAKAIWDRLEAAAEERRKMLEWFKQEPRP